MTSQQYLRFTPSIVALLSSIIWLGGCSKNPNSSNDPHSDYNFPRQSPLNINFPKTSQLPRILVYNGFDDPANNAYQSDPIHLAGDLSAIQPENLYLFDYYTQSVGTQTSPRAMEYKIDYAISLPVSKTQIKTGDTLLNPALSLAKTMDKDAHLPSTTKPVLLCIPSGNLQAPETPFFPENTHYTAVLIQPSTTASRSATVSLQTHPAGSSINPPTFGVFAHQPNKEFNLRFYDKDSTIDNSKRFKLLTESKQPGVIRGRFVSLTASNLPLMSLHSIDQAAFTNLGLSSEQLLMLTHTFFPQLVSVQAQTTATLHFDKNYGMFCVGGNNQFETINLSNQTFIYPQSPAAIKTRVKIVDVAADSGFITASGKHIHVDTLNGQGTLNLIAVLEDALDTAAPPVQITTLNNVDTVNVSIAKIANSFTLPNDGMVLLAYANGPASLTVTPTAQHVGGNVISGTAAYKDNQVILQSLTKISLGSGIIHRLLANHPNTQGLPYHVMSRLISELNPMQDVNDSLGDASAAVMHHDIGLHLSNAYAATSISRIHKNFSLSSNHDLKHKVIAAHMHYLHDKLRMTATMYGAAIDGKDATFGTTLTAFTPINFANNTCVPSMSIGYALKKVPDFALKSDAIHVSLGNAALNSMFTRFMGTFQHNQGDLSLSIAAGLEFRHSTFSNGIVSSDHTEFSLKGNTTNTLHSIVEANFGSPSTRFKFTMWNFNQVQLQLSLTY